MPDFSPVDPVGWKLPIARPSTDEIRKSTTKFQIEKQRGMNSHLAVWFSI
jgi:hypothetical protein